MGTPLTCVPTLLHPWLFLHNFYQCINSHSNVNHVTYFAGYCDALKQSMVTLADTMQSNVAAFSDHTVVAVFDPNNHRVWIRLPQAPHCDVITAVYHLHRWAGEQNRSICALKSVCVGYSTSTFEVVQTHESKILAYQHSKPIRFAANLKWNKYFLIQFQ